MVLQDDGRGGRVEPLLAERQSLSCSARRLSASTLVSRSSWSATGSPVRAPAATEVWTPAEAGGPAIETARKADDDCGHAVVLGGEPADLVRGAHNRRGVEPRDLQTATGRASVRVASLMATPMRRSPTSSPTTRTQPLY